MARVDLAAGRLEKSETHFGNSLAESPMTEVKRDSVDQAEVDRFSAMAREWWDPNGKFKPLQPVQPGPARLYQA